MDKLQRDIVVKINGQERPFAMETEKPPAEMAELEYAQAEASAAKEDEWDDAVFVAPASEKRPIKRSALFRTVNARLKSAVFSILLAVVIGTGFGLAVLHVIPKEKAPASAPNASLSFPAGEQPDAKQEGTAAEGPQGAPQAEAMALSVIQAGVFSDEQAANAYAAKLKTAAIPAVAVGKQPVAVFIGVGVDKPSLEPMNEQLKQKGQTTYIKPVSVEWNAEMSPPLLYKKMADLSVRLLAKGEASEQEWAALQSAYKQWKPDAANKLAQYTKSAYGSLAAYRKRKEEALLWKAQQDLLNALKASMEAN